MGEISDYYIEKVMEDMGAYWLPSGHPLDNDFWITRDHKKLYPAKGEMDEQHIRNAMAFIRKPEAIKAFQYFEVEDLLITPEWMLPKDESILDEIGSEVAYNAGISPGAYFNRRIRNSTLWKALKAGLTYHYNLKQKANELNKGVLEL